MKNSNLFIKLTCIIPALLLLCMVNLKAQNYALNGYTYVGAENDHRFYLSNCKASWEEANEAATEMGGYLATFPRGGGLDPYGDPILGIKYTFPDYFTYHSIWIGYRSANGIYEWANGEPDTYDWIWWSNDPLYDDAAAALTLNRYSDASIEFYSYPISLQALFLVEFPIQPNCSNNPNKTYVCHNGNTICVNITAVQSHLNHGDFEGPCGPCNTNAMVTFPDESPAMVGHSLQSVNAALPEPKEELSALNVISPLNEIHVFPNPASDEIQVELPQLNKEGTLRILSLTGQEIRSLPLNGQQSFSLDLSDYAAGFYLIDVRSAGGHYQKKIVKL